MLYEHVLEYGLYIYGEVGYRVTCVKINVSLSPRQLGLSPNFVSGLSKFLSERTLEFSL